ncbi:MULTISPECIES: hypothetical protein [unclassified Rickettsia]|uniref:hypothetical protein n=1 Tax=unclassified Rickettsia TaxID=114295 RepID=UPI003133177D
MSNKENISKKQIDDLQISNEIKSILSQVSATNNPTELSRLASQIRSLKSDNSYLNNIIDEIQNTIIKKQETSEIQSNSETYARDLEKLQQQLQQEEIQKYKAKVTEQIRELNTKHDKFKENLEEYKKLYTPLEEMVKKDSKGEITIDEKAVDKNILTHQEVEERRQKFAGLKEQEKGINEVFEKAQQEKEELEKEINSLSQIKKQHLTPEQINKLKTNHDKLAANKELLEKVREIRQNIKSDLDKLKSSHEKDHIHIKQFKDAIEKTEHTRSPDKHEQLKQKHVLLYNQHDAITNNKELDEKDKKIRQNVKTQHQCDKIKDSLTNSEPKKTISQNVQPQINNQKKIGREI